MQAPTVTPQGGGTLQQAQAKATKQMNDVQFLFFAFKQSFVALAFLRIITSKFGGHVFDDVIAAVVAMVIGLLLRHKTTRKVLPQRIVALWEPLRKIRKSRVLKLKASILIDTFNYAAFFQPLYVKLIFGKTGWTPVGVFLVQYLYESYTLACVNLSQICSNAANFVPSATLGWLDENGFINKKDIFRVAREPGLAKQLTKQFFKRVKEFWKEEQERRKLGMSEEEAVMIFAKGVSSSMGAGVSSSSSTMRPTAAEVSSSATPAPLYPPSGVGATGTGAVGGSSVAGVSESGIASKKGMASKVGTLMGKAATKVSQAYH